MILKLISYLAIIFSLQSLSAQDLVAGTPMCNKRITREITKQVLAQLEPGAKFSLADLVQQGDSGDAAFYFAYGFRNGDTSLITAKAIVDPLCRVGVYEVEVSPPSVFEYFKHMLTVF